MTERPQIVVMPSGDEWLVTVNTARRTMHRACKPGADVAHFLTATGSIWAIDQNERPHRFELCVSLAALDLTQTNEQTLARFLGRAFKAGVDNAVLDD